MSLPDQQRRSRTGPRGNLGVAASLAALVLVSTMLWAGDAVAGSVALPKATGSKKSGVAAVEAEVKRGLSAAGHRVITGKPLAVAAKRAKRPAADLAVAKLVGADFIATLEAKPAGKAFVATLVVRDLTGRTIYEDSQKYAGAKKARPAGAALGQGAARALSGASTAAPFAEAPPAPPSVERREAPEDESAPMRPSASATPPPARPPPPVEEQPKEAPAAPGKKSGERPPVLYLRAGGGLQAATSYAVVVGGTANSMGYSLKPVLLIAGELAFRVPSTQLHVNAELAFAPAKFSLLGVDPDPEPVEPTGSFLDFRAGLSYRLALSGKGWRDGFTLEPLVAFGLTSMSVTEQVPAVVISEKAMGLDFGVRPNLALSPSFELFLDLRFRWLFAYSESPTKTGDSGKGIGIRAGGGVRYWLFAPAAITLEVGYAYQKIGLTGPGDRQTFDGDAPLVDASTASSNLRLSLGAAVAF